MAPGSPSPRSGGPRRRCRFDARPAARRNRASARDEPGPRRVPTWSATRPARSAAPGSALSENGATEIRKVPVGTTDDSPAIHRRVSRQPCETSRVPTGTTEDRVATVGNYVRTARPFVPNGTRCGLRPRSGRARAPAVSRLENGANDGRDATRGPGLSEPEVGLTSTPLSLRCSSGSATKPCLGSGRAGPTQSADLVSDPTSPKRSAGISPVG